MGIKNIKPLLTYKPEKYVYQMFGVRANNRNELIIYLKSKGIATGSHYTPLTKQPLFEPYRKDCDYIEKEADKLLTLPLHADLTDKEVEYIIYHLKEFNKI